MGQMLTKQSPKIVVEQARALKVDPLVLAAVRDNIWQAGNSMTLIPSRGSMLPDRNAYSGDLSKENVYAICQVRPLLSFEYRSSHHTAIVKHGLTGEVLMMLVREPSDNQWFGENRSVGCGGETEARLYANGSPIGVDISTEFLDVIPPPVEDIRVIGREVTGASMTELMKVKDKEKRRLVLYRKKDDGTQGSALAAYTKIRKRMGVFRILDPEAIDPIASLALAWYNTIEMY